MGNRNHFWLRFISAILDISTIFCIASLSQLLINRHTFIGFGTLFIMVFIGYYFLSYLFLEGRTPPKILTGLKIIRTDDKKASPVTFLIREILLKGLVGIMTSLCVFEYIPRKTNSIVISVDLILVVILAAVFLVVFKKTWWEWLSKTKTIRVQHGTKIQLTCSCFILSALYISCIVMAVGPFLTDIQNLPNRLPAPYPNTKEVKQYAGFIKNQAKDPVDYLFDLFQKNDIVVISERMHPEYSQYEFLFKVINDKRFTLEVGNLFTECGSVSYQDSLDHYLHTEYETEDALNRATARLQINSNAVWPMWNNTNLFDMFKTVNTLNNRLVDSNKINWYFTDLPVKWETATHETFINNSTSRNRDSFMAMQVIEKYNKVISLQRRHKALVIMNSYHGYGLAPNGKHYFGSTTENVMEALPGKVVNVMLNTMSMKYLWAFIPVQNGKWDAAFELAGNPAKGFDFATSPFGDDHFDATFLQVNGLNYQDVFTGFIFYTPLSKQFCKSDFPFEFENTEKELLRRGGLVGPEYVEVVKKEIAYQRAHPQNPYTIRGLNLSLGYNLANGVAIPFLLFLCLTIVLITYFVKVKQLNKLRPINRTSCGTQCPA